mgnify:CR=1 FL=1
MSPTTLLGLFGRRIPVRILGRWALNQTTKQKEKKVHWANVDHCGDLICGNVKEQKILKKQNV